MNILLNKVLNVQECDATMYHSSTKVGLQKFRLAVLNQLITFDAYQNYYGEKES
jgi:hypothetical protein